MAKRIFSLIAVVAMIISVCSTTVNATIYVNHDFDEPDIDVNDGKILQISGKPKDSAWIIEQSDDALYYYKEAGVRGDDNIEWKFTLPDYTLSEGEEVVFTFDYMIPDVDTMNDASYYYGDIFFGGRRISFFLHDYRMKHSSGSWGRTLLYKNVFPEADGDWGGKWMSMAIHIYWHSESDPTEDRNYDGDPTNDNYWTGDFYIKPKGAEEWSVKAENINVVAHGNDYVRFFVYGDFDAEAYFDNFRIFVGTEALNGEISLDDTLVQSVQNITAGELAASNTVLTSTPEENLRKIMVAYDKSGKMIDFSTSIQNLNIGANDVSGKLILDDAEAAAIADGGYVGLYLWDGMLPYINAVELK